MTAPTCPACGGNLTITPNGVIVAPVLLPFMIRGQELPVRQRIAHFATCDACEFVHEIRPPKFPLNLVGGLHQEPQEL